MLNETNPIEKAIQQKYSKFYENLDGLTSDELRQKSEEDLRIGKAKFEIFKVAFNQGLCLHCGTSLSDFRLDRECFHWLLFPKGMKNKYILRVLKSWPFHDVQSYLRAYSTLIGGPSEINDLVLFDEKNSIVSYTVRIRKRTFTFSLKTGDLEGHGGHGPHYHMQISDANGCQLKFKEHLPLHRVDLQLFALRNKGKIDFEWGIGKTGIREQLGLETEFWLPSEVPSNVGEDVTVFSATPVNMGRFVDLDKIDDVIEAANQAGLSVPEYMEKHIKPEWRLAIQRHSLPAPNYRHSRGPVKGSGIFEH